MKRRKAKRRASSRTVAKKVYRRSRSAAKGMAPLLAAGIYGAGRQKLAEFIQPVAARIPGGNIADEVAMIGANWAIKKFIGGKVPIIGQAAKTGMLIEAAAIGEAIASGSLGIGAASSNGGGAVVIG